MRCVFTIGILILLACLAFSKTNNKDTIQDEKFSFDEKKKAPLPTCEWDYKYDVKKSVVAGLCVVFGFFILVVGYRRRRISFCMTGFSSIGILTYMIVVAEAQFSTVVNILIAVAAGFIASFFTTLVLYCGYFITGLFAGFTIGFLFLLIFTTFMPLDSIALPCVVIAAFGIVQTFITMWWRHRVLIVSSCLFASAVMSISVDYFVEDLFILEYIEMKIFYNRITSLCWWSYIVFGLWPLFCIIGLLVQCLLTGKEKQKEAYTFIYRRNRRPLSHHFSDDQNHLIRQDYNRNSP